MPSSLPFACFVRARLQPCRHCRTMNSALAAEVMPISQSPATVPLKKHYIHAIQDTGSSQSQSAELALRSLHKFVLSESKGSAPSIQNECGLTISLLKQSNARGLNLQPAVEPQHYERAWLIGQLTRICRFTGRPGKASTPKNSGRKTQKRKRTTLNFCFG
jgi:hypothetical protein